MQDNGQSVFLLPGFDEYLLAYKERSASLDVPNYKRSTPPNGMLPATIVINGRVIGTWKRSFQKDIILITLNPFSPITATERNRVSIAAHRFGQFLRKPVALS